VFEIAKLANRRLVIRPKGLAIFNNGISQMQKFTSASTSRYFNRLVLLNPEPMPKTFYDRVKTSGG
jgi:hypothetical protein